MRRPSLRRIHHEFGRMGEISQHSGLILVAQSSGLDLCAHRVGHKAEPGLSLGLTDHVGLMAHPKPWMASLFAIGLRASPELHKEHPETFTGTIEVIGRVERGQDRICDDAVVETIDTTVEELGVDPIEQRLI